MSEFILNNLNRALIIFIAVIIISLLTIGNVSASSLDSIQLLKISAQDERAIIKTPDGKIQIIKPGDMVGNDNKVVEITAGRVVFEEKTGKESETVIFRLEDGKQRVERIKKVAEKQPSLYAVKTHEQKAPGREPAKGKKKKDKKSKPKNSSVVN